MEAHPLPPAGTIATQLLIVAALVLANAFFVAAEFALVSVRKTRIDQLAAEGSASAIIVQKALRDLNSYIGAAQVGITVVSLLLGSTGEKVFEPLFLPLFSWLPQPLLGITRAGLAFTLAYIVMTSMHVILGEQLPKIIAIQKADQASFIIARPMVLFTRLCAPLVWFQNVCVNFLMARLGLQAMDEHAQVHSPEELNLIITESHEGGQLNATEAEILHRVVRFSDLTAREVMVPRVEMQALPVEMPRAALLHYLSTQPRTRVPVYHGALDEIVGIAHLKDLVRFESALSNDGQGATVNLMPLVREAARVPESITIDRLLIEFKKRRQQMAIVIDEFGGTSGLITMGDLLDQVFGEVRDEFDAPEPEHFNALPDGRIQMPGRVLIDEVNERYSLALSSEDADTMAGFVLDVLGRPAQVGDEVEANGARVRVEEVDRLRITALTLQLPAEAGDNAAPDANLVSAKA